MDCVGRRIRRGSLAPRQGPPRLRRRANRAPSPESLAVTDEWIAQQYIGGKSIREVADDSGLSIRKVRDVLDRLNVPRRGRGRQAELDAAATLSA